MKASKQQRKLTTAHKALPPGRVTWHHHHILDLDDFTKSEIELIFEITDAMMEILGRDVKRVPVLRGKTVVILFYEPSTRTRTSFELAAKNLSADVTNITTSVSSVAKGESFVDTLRTIQALGADVIVLRHPQSGAPYLATQHLDVSVINGGDGCHAHPSQALLDLYTLRNHFKKIEKLKVVIVGDILHSRVARSNILGLEKFGAEIVLCAPPTLIPPSFNQLETVSIEYNLNRALKNADVIMPLRLQKERQDGGLIPDIREYIKLYQLTPERLSLAKPEAIVLHPGPVNEGVEIAPEVTYGPRSVIEEQVTNGVAIRMTLLYLVTGGK